MVAASSNGVAKQGGGFLDPWFRLFRGRRVPPAKPAGTGGTQVSGGYVVRVDRDRRLQGATRWKTFSELIANVDIVTAAVREFTDLVGAAEWRFEPADESAQAQEYADAVEKILHGMTTPWFEVVKRLAMYPFMGFAVAEWTSKPADDEGVIGFLDVEPRPQSTIERWDIDQSGTVHGVVQRSPHDYKDHYLPRGKLLYIADRTVDDAPDGFGLLRACAPHATLMAEYERLERAGYQGDIAGIPLGRAPLAENAELVEQGKLSEKKRAEQEAVLNDILQSHIRSETLGAMLDSAVYEAVGDGKSAPSAIYKWGLDVVKSTPTSQEELAAAIERKTRSIARILGIEHRLLGSDSKGSHALGEGKAKSFGLMVDGTLKATTYTVRSDLIRPIFRLNGWDEALMPWPQTDLSRFRDVTEVTGALKDLAVAGAPMAPDDPAQNAVRGMLGVPEADLDKLAEDAALAREQAAEMAAGLGGAVPPGNEDKGDADGDVGGVEDDEDDE